MDPPVEPHEAQVYASAAAGAGASGAVASASFGGQGQGGTGGEGHAPAIGGGHAHVAGLGDEGQLLSGASAYGFGVDPRSILPTVLVVRAGELKKKSPALLKGWQRRYFVLDQYALRYYAKEEDFDADPRSFRGEIQLALLQGVAADKAHAEVFSLSILGVKHQRKLARGKRHDQFELSAEGAGEAQDWMEVLRLLLPKLSLPLQKKKEEHATKAGKMAGWQSRHFVLVGRVLYYFKVRRIQVKVLKAGICGGHEKLLTATCHTLNAALLRLTSAMLLLQERGAATAQGAVVPRPLRRDEQAASRRGEGQGGEAGDRRGRQSEEEHGEGRCAAAAVQHHAQASQGPPALRSRPFAVIRAAGEGRMMAILRCCLRPYPVTTRAHICPSPIDVHDLTVRSLSFARQGGGGFGMLLNDEALVVAFVPAGEGTLI